MSTMDKSAALKHLSRASSEKPGTKKPESEAGTEGDSDEIESLSIAEMESGPSFCSATKNLPRIHFILKNGTRRSLQFAYLDVESIFDGRKFVLIFAGTKHWQVTVTGHGKEFWKAYDLITLHRCQYIREATGSMVSDEALFTSVEFVDITPQE